MSSLQYDDGTAYWLTWAGLGKGVWFDVTDFDPSGGVGLITSLEYWFYHSPSFPWDTSGFYAVLSSGNGGGPAIELDHTSMTALHYAPSYASYLPWGIIVGENFWGIANCKLSSGGWPSILVDTPAPGICHSFYTEDFTSWLPYMIQSNGADYFLRANGVFGTSLERTTWGSLKTLF